MYQQYICASLVKIHLSIQEIGCRQTIFRYTSTSCDLKMGSEPPKSISFLSITCASFFPRNSFIPLGDRVQPTIFYHCKFSYDLENGLKAPNFNKLFSLFSLTRKCNCVSFVKVLHRLFRRLQTKGYADADMDADRICTKNNMHLTPWRKTIIRFSSL